MVDGRRVIILFVKCIGQAAWEVANARYAKSSPVTRVVKLEDAIRATACLEEFHFLVDVSEDAMRAKELKQAARRNEKMMRWNARVEEQLSLVGMGYPREPLPMIETRPSTHLFTSHQVVVAMPQGTMPSFHELAGAHVRSVIASDLRLQPAQTQTSPAPFEGLGLGAQDPHTPEITSLVGAEAQTSQSLEPLDPNGAGGKAAPISYAFAAPVLPL